MDDKDALAKLKEYGLENVIKFETIENSGHQVVFNNPMEVAKKITEDYKFEWKPLETKDYVDDETLEIKFTD